MQRASPWPEKGHKPLTPWWLRPTAEGAKEEKEDRERAAEKAPESTPSPLIPSASEAVSESVPPTPEAPREGPAWWKEPSDQAFLEETEEVETPLGHAELLPEADEAEEEDDEELTAQSETGEAAGGATEEEARAEARRRRPRRSRGRGRKEGRITVLNPPEAG